MRVVDVFCVFPGAVEAAVGVGVVGRALERGVVELRTHDLREHAPGGRIDDMPFGGGAGMVVRVDVVARALESVYGVPARRVKESRRVVLTEAWGTRISQPYVESVARGPDVTILCGRYGGMDERVRQEIATEAVSLGDFVLSGGEIVAAALVDGVVRLVEGVLGNAESLAGETFSEADAVGPPVYTRPAVWDGERVPGVLLSGNHAEIRSWRRRASEARAHARGVGRGGRETDTGEAR